MLHNSDAINTGATKRDHWASHLVRPDTENPAWRFIHTTYGICGTGLFYTWELQAADIVLATGGSFVLS